MWVKQLIGRLAGTVVDVPFSAAENAVANGTAMPATDDEVLAAGFDPAPATLAPNVDVLPDGYRAQPTGFGGYDLFDGAGLMLNEQPLANMAAVLSFAHEHREATVLPPDTVFVPLPTLPDLDRIRADFDTYRIDAGETGFLVYDGGGVLIDGGPFADAEAADLARNQHLAAAHGLTLEEYEALGEDPNDGLDVVEGEAGDAIVVPEDWRTLSGRQRKTLAARIVNRRVGTTVEADGILEERVVSRAA